MSNIKDCYEIYRKVFGDEDTEFESRLFKYCFDCCKYISENGKAVSMLFALPCELVTEQEITPALYIYAVATLKEYRGKGYASALIESLKEEHGKLLLLRPAERALIPFYEGLQFKTVTAQCDIDSYPLIKPVGSYAELVKAYKPENGKAFTAMYYAKDGMSICDLHFIHSME